MNRLNRLELYNYYQPVSDDRARDILSKMDKETKKKSSLGLTSPYYSHSKNLKDLQLYLPNLPASYIKYLTTYVLKQLDTLVIKVSDNNLYDWIYQVGLKNVTTLTQSVQHIKNLTILFYPPLNRTRKSSSAFAHTFLLTFIIQ